MSIEEKDLVIVDVKISPESTTVGKAVKDLSLPRESKLALIIPGEGSAHVPTANTVLQAGDQIIAVTYPGDQGSAAGRPEGSLDKTQRLKVKALAQNNNSFLIL